MSGTGFGDTLDVTEVLEYEQAALSSGAMLAEVESMVRGLAHQMATRYTHLGIDADLLIADGLYGAYLATANYDPAKGASWTTYAHPWVTRYMTLGARFHAGETTRGDGGGHVSLDALKEAEDNATWDIEDETIPEPETGSVRETVRLAVTTLEPTLRQIVYRSYWTDQGPTEIGRALDMPKSTVRKYHAKALDLLQERLDGLEAA